MTVSQAPDTMSKNITGLLPVAKRDAIFTALRRRAETLQYLKVEAPRTISQIMTDTFFTRLTDGGQLGGVEIQHVMNERSLLRGDREPPLRGVRTFPPPWPAGWCARPTEPGSPPLRRSYSGELVAMDGKRGPSRQARDLSVLRDQTSPTPSCDAPIAHVDHTRSARRGGETTAANGQGLSRPATTRREHPGGAPTW